MSNSITIAPQVNDISSLFQAWKRSHIGSYSDFTHFMTMPSGERTRFLSTLQVTGMRHGSLLFNQVTTS